MNESYRVTTQHGFYFATGNGKYGRFTGSKHDAWILCETHASAVAEVFNSYGGDDKAILQSVENYNGFCQQCRIEGRKQEA